jgi:hypothetical protein
MASEEPAPMQGRDAVAARAASDGRGRCSPSIRRSCPSAVLRPLSSIDRPVSRGRKQLHRGGHQTVVQQLVFDLLAANPDSHAAEKAHEAPTC